MLNAIYAVKPDVGKKFDEKKMGFVPLTIFIDYHNDSIIDKYYKD